VTSAATQTDVCVVCGGQTRLCLDLNKQPLANELLSAASQNYRVHPLGIAFCNVCSHGQLTHFVDPDDLFLDYRYVSGTSITLKNFFMWYAASLARALRPDARVLEIACNDGSLLSCFMAAGLHAVGVDPASNLTRLARDAGHEVLTGFFPYTRPEGKFDAITAMNVVAHTPTPFTFMQAIKDVLAPGGVAIIQTSQAMMLENGEFDTVYHEHYSYFTCASMNRLAARCGLRIESRKLVTVHGGSLMFILRHVEEMAAPLNFEGGVPFEIGWPSPEPAIFSLNFEGGQIDAAYKSFAERARAKMMEVRNKVTAHRAEGATIALVGVAAKALTFIRAADIKPDIYLDEAELKLGLSVPGTPHVIQPLEMAARLSANTLFLIGAWNFATELTQKLRTLRPGTKTKLLIYFPYLKESG
jgi:2-polyprenyl-3-methyl-5-hydroxy-6-metoxy-1,4-benzoquinol methylase